MKDVVDWYDSFVRSQYSKIYLYELPESIPNSKGYFTLKEATDYYYENMDYSKAFELQNELNRSYYDDVFKNNNSIEYRIKLYGSKQVSQKGALKFFFNKEECPKSKDLLSQISCVEKLEEKINKEEFGIDKSVRGLIYSKHYVPKKNDKTLIPDNLIMHMETILSNTKAFLSNEEFMKVKDVSISFQEKDGKILWVSNRNSIIYISPFLIRATFILSVYDDFGGSGKYIELLREVVNNPAQYHDVQYFIDIKNNILKKFEQSFYFILGHELAHIYLNQKIGDLETEKLCDCYSALRIIRNKNSLEIGVYNSLLEESLRQGQLSLWQAVEKSGDLMERSKSLNELIINQDFIQCR